METTAELAEDLFKDYVRSRRCLVVPGNPNEFPAIVGKVLNRAARKFARMKTRDGEYGEPLVFDISRSCKRT
jgi:hypothetical protein